MFSAVDCLLLPNNAAGQLLLMQKVKSHKAKSQNSLAADLIACNRLPKAQSRADFVWSSCAEGRILRMS